MQVIERFRLQYTTPEIVREPLSPELRFDGAPVKLELPRGAISGQFACRHGFLLLFCDTGYDGDELHLLLLSPQLEPLDAVEVGSARFFGLSVHPATLTALRVVGDDELQFDFGYTWCVRLLHRPTRVPQERWSANLFREPEERGLRRYLWFRRLRWGRGEMR